MASRAKRLPTNAEGEFFVDSTCIDCDACRWIAPATFDRSGEHSRVHTQPETAGDRRRALLALIACPTGSIGAHEKNGGAQGKNGVLWARGAFPVAIDGEVHHSGWHSEKSFGATSYLIRRPAERGGNVLVDSPRFSEPLARRLEELGGVTGLFLTHQDDVADHQRFHDRFGCWRAIHREDLQMETRDVERVLEGEGSAAIDAELLAIPTPGHTRGSTCLVFKDAYLFSGDHLAYSPRLGHLYGFRDACWHDWARLVRSTERLQSFRFEWVLPGHGRRAHFPGGRMGSELERAIAWMHAAA